MNPADGALHLPARAGIHGCHGNEREALQIVGAPDIAAELRQDAHLMPHMHQFARHFAHVDGGAVEGRFADFNTLLQQIPDLHATDGCSDCGSGAN